jgi:Mitochondrial ribosomal subunit S27
LEDLKNAFKKYDLEVINPKEEDRLESIAIAKLRGKGPPKKQREKDGEPDLSTEVVGTLICNFSSSVEGEEEEEMRPAKIWTTLRSDRRHPSVAGVISRYCTKCHHTCCIERTLHCFVPYSTNRKTKSFQCPFSICDAALKSLYLHPLPY